MNGDLVSIYVVTCNRVGLLKRCIDSIRKQKYANIEIIVVDDCSSDSTKEYLYSISNEDKRIKFFINDKNMGACHSRNIAIKNAQGKYITGCDDDDYFKENRIDHFLKKHELLDSYSFIYSSNIFDIGRKYKKSLPNKLSPKITSANDLLFYNSVGNQIFTKTELLRKYLFNESLPAWQDLECWHRILLEEKSKALNVGGFTYIQDVAHEGNRISTSKLAKIDEARKIIIKNRDLSRVDGLILMNHFRPYENYKYIRMSSIKAMLLSKFTFFTIFLSFLYVIKFLKAKV
ncbi:glycosyltransferase [Tatumella ptyseos]|uniref:glycosyltransferase n=1 Tax=Tatumella ptyseos TaxID=82987 RepID=UPI0023EFBB5B|nr:glycosyltransferase [Tatumella ptyseos]